MKFLVLFNCLLVWLIFWFVMLSFWLILGNCVGMLLVVKFNVFLIFGI